ncbi:MAG: VOC family protein [Syntrophomonadaceae bacterium]|jgi:predicted enzyme related to lactoylglutathione lyase
MKYVHTNIIARDWKSLAQFYMDVFDCQIAPPERDLHGLWADQLSGIDNVRIRGVHLRLPGYTDGPTLEIFQYEPAAPGNNEPVVNSPGYSHLAFEVDSVEDVLDKLLQQGGKTVGQLIHNQVGVGTLTAVYARDPEGNIIEIMHWDR